MTLGSAFATRPNSFDLMRLGGALLVLLSHAWVLTGRPDAEPFARAMAHEADGGSLAVGMFFVLSGFLVARSAEQAAARPGGVLRFLRARFLRLYPALAVLVVAQTLGLGLLATRLPAWAFLTDPGTWAALARGLVFSPALGLPGVFEANPVAFAVNGSLWTLRIEAACYAGLLGLALLRLLRPGWVLLPLGAAFALLGATVAARAGLLPAALATLKVVSIVDCLVNLMSGAGLWVYRNKVPHHGALALGGLALLAVAAGSAAMPLLLHLVLPYLVLWLGLRPSGADRVGSDISYGIYLYAFPVAQAVVAWLGPGIGPAGSIVLTLPPTLLCAVLSRRLVEEPALRLRGLRA